MEGPQCKGYIIPGRTQHCTTLPTLSCSQAAGLSRARQPGIRRGLRWRCCWRRLIRRLRGRRAGRCRPRWRGRQPYRDAIGRD